MRRTWKSVGAAIAVLTLAGCASITSVPAGPVSLGEKHQVVLGREWSDVSALVPQRSKKVRVLTIDGPMLNRVYIAPGLAPGEGLLKRIDKEHPAPTFKADMGPRELIELVADSVAAAGYQRVETSNLRPAKFGAANAVRFDLNAKTVSGLEVQGLAQVAAISSKFYLVLYLAPAEHYFQTNVADVEAILNSAT